MRAKEKELEKIRLERNSQQAGAETRARPEREQTQSLSKHKCGHVPCMGGHRVPRQGICAVTSKRDDPESQMQAKKGKQERV